MSAREESVDLTPGVVWTDAQLDIIRTLTTQLYQAQNAVERVRQLHAEKYGCCYQCSHASSVPWPCPTICALDGTQ